MGLLSQVFKGDNSKGGVHIRGEICPRSDPDIAHMEYSMEPLNVIYIIIVYQGANDSGSLEFSHVKSS